MPKQDARPIYLRPVDGLTKNVSKLTSRGFWFPMAPDTYSVSGNAEWATVQVVGLGQVAHPVGSQLNTVSFTSFFPPPGPKGAPPRIARALRDDQDYRAPDVCCELLDTLRDDLDLMWLVIGTDIPDTGTNLASPSGTNQNILKEIVCITQFQWSEASGRLDGRIFTISFQAWEPQTVIQRGRNRIFALPKVYVTKAGEDLRDVAIRFYGDPNVWKKIAAKNDLKTVSVKTGTKLKLPADAPSGNAGPITGGAAPGSSIASVTPSSSIPQGATR